MEKKQNSFAESEIPEIKLNGTHNNNFKFKILIGLIFFLIIALLIAITFDTVQEVRHAKSTQNGYTEKIVLVSGKPAAKIARALTHTPVIDRTNWKTYTSKSGFFTLSYPSIFSVYEEAAQYIYYDEKYMDYTISFGNAAINNSKNNLLTNPYNTKFNIEVTNTDKATLSDYLRSINTNTNLVFIEDLPIRYGADEAMRITNANDDTRVERYYKFGNKIISIKVWEIANNLTPTPVPDYSKLLVKSRIYETLEFDKNKLPNL